MILPHPDSDLQRNLMVLSADIVKLLSSKNRKNSFVLVENIMEEFLRVNEKRSPEMFLNSLTFLFSVGVIEKNEYRIRLLIPSKKSKQTELF